MDVIDTLAGIAAGSHLDSVRRTRRAIAREHAQKSYDSLFTPADYGEIVSHLLVADGLPEARASAPRCA